MRMSDFSIICTMVLALMPAAGGASAGGPAAGDPGGSGSAAHLSPAGGPAADVPASGVSPLLQPHTHTIGLELGFVLIPFGFEDPYSAPIGASLFYEFRPGSVTLPIFIGAIVSYFDFNPLNEYFGDSFMVQVGLYAGYEFVLFRTETNALVLSPYSGYKHYFREHIFWDDSISTNRPVIAVGTKLNLHVSRRFSFGLGLEYNLILDEDPIHTLVQTDRFSVGF